MFPRASPTRALDAVSSLGGTCGTETDDSATVDIAITGPSAESGSTSCQPGLVELHAPDPELSHRGRPTAVVVTQTDAAGNIGSDTESVSVDNPPTADVDRHRRADCGSRVRRHRDVSRSPSPTPLPPTR